MVTASSSTNIQTQADYTDNVDVSVFGIYVYYFTGYNVLSVSLALGRWPWYDIGTRNYQRNVIRNTVVLLLTFPTCETMSVKCLTLLSYYTIKAWTHT